MRGRSELIVLAVMGVLLVVASILSARNEAAEGYEYLSGSTYSAGEGGARALYLWLEELGYSVERLEASPLHLDSESGVLWVFAPSPFYTITGEEAVTIADWVREGGTLVWADRFPGGALLAELEVENDFLTNVTGTRYHPVVPWVRHPRAAYSGSLAFELPEGATHLLADKDGNIGAFRQKVGKGEIWLFAILTPFTNKGLHDEANSALLLGLLEHLPAGSTMTFDEVHHGFGNEAGSETRTLMSEMRRSPWGWGIFYGAGVLGFWILLRGRSFGRPLPLPGEHLRREAGEYARSMAWLYRRARLRAPILQHHHTRLKRHLTERYRLPPIENDDAFVSALARFHPNLDEQALRAHLHALRRPHPSESQLLTLARANDEWLEQLGGR